MAKGKRGGRLNTGPERGFKNPPNLNLSRPEGIILPGPPAQAEKNPGHNDPCSCGSGKKFKKCCSKPVKPTPGFQVAFEECKHPDEYLVPTHGEVWDDDKHCGLDSYEIRKKFPRQRCRLCGTIHYRSYGHYIAGDW